MIPVELDRGKSFEGLGKYLLNDVKADTSERVGWTQTYNLADADPNRAWRLMAATAMSAKALKEAAGLRTSGGQNKKPVYHFTVSWPEVEEPKVDLQRKAVEEALDALGMSEHQALAVEHTDTPHTHVHVMVNLIHPENGTTAKLSHTQKKLRSWANKFELEHNLQITEGSHENEKKRQKGEKVDARRKSRKQWEYEQREGKDKRMAWHRRQQADLKIILSKEAEAMKERHNAEWSKQRQSWNEKKKTHRAERDFETGQAISDLKQIMKPDWVKAFKENSERLKRFDKSEKNTLMQVMNTASAFIKGRKQGDTVAMSLLGAFKQSERRGFIEIENQGRLDETRKQVNKRIKTLRDAKKKEYSRIMQGHIAGYCQNCAELAEKQKIERKDMQAKWKGYHSSRKQSHEQLNQYDKRQEQQQARGLERGYGLDYEPPM